MQLFDAKVSFSEPFEQKTFILGMNSIIEAANMQGDCPQEVSHPATLAKLICEVILMLT
jgi:hypothetical protein